MKKKTTLFLSVALVSVIGSYIQAQNVVIPDPNFKAILVASSINTNSDTEIQMSEAQAYSGTMNVSNCNINSLIGIEAFTALTVLYCEMNQLTSLDVSNNTALTLLRCSYNQLTSLNVSTNTNLEWLYCQANQLTSLDVSNNTALTVLRCYGNQLTSLDVSSNTVLDFLQCAENQLTSLDVSSNTVLKTLDCIDNQLTSLDVSSNMVLEGLFCSDNQLTSLDVSSNTFLKYLQCRYNQLTSLNVKNGNNSNVITFWARYNPSLTCIEVDDAAYSTTNWTIIDQTSFFSEVCYTNISQTNDILPDLSAYPNPTASGLSLQLGKNLAAIKVLVMNTIGQVVFEKNYSHTAQVELKLEGAAGVYFVRVQTAEGESTLKVVKE